MFNSFKLKTDNSGSSAIVTCGFFLYKNTLIIIFCAVHVFHQKLHFGKVNNFICGSVFGVNSCLSLQEENRKAGDPDASHPEDLEVGDSNPVRTDSPKLLKCDDADAEKQRNLEALLPCRITPLNLPSSVAPFSKKDFIVTAVQDNEANGASESEEKVAGVRPEESSELNVENVSPLKMSRQTTPEPDVREDEETENDKMSDQRNILTVPENTPVVCNIKSSAADDLDEMMDIGTVDQADQEAQMKIEDPLNLDTACSPASSNRGELRFDAWPTAK